MTYTRARILTRLWPVASLAGLMGGCGEQTPTEVISENRINGPRYIEYSSGFYPSGDGYYFWDGQAPSGDFAPAIIQNAKAGGMAPRPGTEGWVEGEMETDGDQYKMDLVFSVDHNGQAVFSNSTFSSNWKWGSMEPRQGDARLLTYYKYDRSLNVQGDIDQRCDYTLENGGTAYARKAVPFGISLNLIKPSLSISWGTFTWGDALPTPMLAFSDPGLACDAPPDGACDLPSTPQREYCPVPGDPNRRPPNYGNETTVTDVRGVSGGYSSPGGYSSGGYRCVEWTDWWISYDGGRSWYYDGRTCNQYEPM